MLLVVGMFIPVSHAPTDKHAPSGYLVLLALAYASTFVACSEGQRMRRLLKLTSMFSFRHGLDVLDE